MTESPFPFGSEEPTPSVDEAEESSTRKPLLLALGGLAVVALAGGYLLLGAGGADVEEDAVPLAGASRAAGPAAAAPVPSSSPQAVPAAFEGVTGRNPFKALYVAPVGGGGGGTAPTAVGQSGTAPTASGGGTTTVSGSSGGTPTSTTVVVARPSTGTGTSTTTQPAPSGTSTAPPVQTSPARVNLNMRHHESMPSTAWEANIKNGTWLFDVAETPGAADTESFTVRPGDSFGKYFKLVRLVYRDGGLGQCADLRFGEQPLQMCEGDNIQF